MEIINFIEKMTNNALIVPFLWAIMIAVVIIDLWTGIDKAKARNEPIHSKAMRMTFVKIGEYWRVLVMFLLADAVGAMLTWYNLPYASMLCTLAIICIELKSVMENLRAKKSSASEITEMVKEIISIDDAEKAVKFLKNLNK